MTEEYIQGLDLMTKVDGEHGLVVLEKLKDIAPDLGKYIVEFAFGQVYNRAGLDLKTREIATIAALTALGNARPQLKTHIHAALNVGNLKDEIIEVIIQMALYAGFPAALNAILTAQEVFRERGFIETKS